MCQVWFVKKIVRIKHACTHFVSCRWLWLSTLCRAFGCLGADDDDDNDVEVIYLTKNKGEQYDKHMTLKCNPMFLEIFEPKILYE